MSFWKTFIIYVGIIGIVASIILILTQTSIIYSRNGEVIYKEVTIEIPENEFIGGSLVMKRNDITPIAYDWVTEKIVSFSVDQERNLKINVPIHIPENTESQTYYIDYDILFYETGIKETIGRFQFFVN